VCVRERERERREENVIVLYAHVRGSE
jgi:hypothetical protein